MARAEASSVTSVSITRASDWVPIRSASSSSAVAAAGGDGHPGPFGRQSQGGRLPDATRCPGDQGHGSFQTTRHRPLPIGVLVAGGCAPRGTRVHGSVVHCTVYQQWPGLRSPGGASAPALRAGSPAVWTSAGCDPGGRAMRPFASTWRASRTGCAGDLVDGSTCRRAAVSTPGSRAAHTIGAVVTGEPHLALRLDTDPARSVHLGRVLPARPSARNDRPQLDAFPPSWTYPFVSLYGNKFPAWMSSARKGANCNGRCRGHRASRRRGPC